MSDGATLGFIGLGVMGEPICRNLLRAHDGAMAVFDLSRDAMAGLAAGGARAMDSAAEVASEADILFLSLPGGPEVEATCLGPDGVLETGRRDQLVADLSTCPVETTRRIAARLAEQGIIFADAPVARTRQAAIDGTLSIMVGGDDATFERLRPILAAAASEITHCGSVGAGQVVKLMNNMVLFQNVVAIAEALAVGSRAGVDKEILAATLSKGSADSFALRNHGMKAMLPGVFPEDAFPTDYAIKDIAYALDLARDCGVETPGAALARSILEATSAAGLGKAYFPALATLVAGEAP